MNTENQRNRYVVPGEVIWSPVESETQLLRQLGLSVPRFTRIAVGAVINQQNQHTPAHMSYPQLRERIRQELVEHDAEQYLLQISSTEYERVIHRLIDLAFTVANILRMRLKTLLGFKDWSLMVEDVILPRHDMVVSYETSDTDIQPATQFLSPPGYVGGARTSYQTRSGQSELPFVGYYPGRR